MANGYDAHSLKATGVNAQEAMTSSAVQAIPVAVRDKRFTRRGIGYRTQQEAAYAGGTASRKRGQADDSKRPWETAQEATSPQIRPRAMLERFSDMNEALPPWLKGKEDDEEQKEAAVALVRENMGLFPCEDDARIALAVLSQFVDGDVLDSVQSAIEDQYGDPGDRPEPMPEPEWDDEEYGGGMPLGLMGESALSEAPLDAATRNKLPDSAFALPGRKYPIDTPERARSALARVNQFGSDEDKRKVLAAVKKRYPKMDVK